jgi:hypothetical protein
MKRNTKILEAEKGTAVDIKTLGPGQCLSWLRLMSGYYVTSVTTDPFEILSSSSYIHHSAIRQ